MRNLLLTLFTFISLLSLSQGPNSCACVWSDINGDLNCQFGNCGGSNWSNCYNKVSTPNLWHSGQCPDPPATNCNPYMWNTGTNGACWYQGSGCSGEVVCQWVATIPLSVELISLSAYNDGDENIIKWSCATETNSKWFHIYHFTSVSDTAVSIITLPASGNTQTQTNYIARHTSPEKIINYYYIVEVDIDGLVTKWGTIAVDNNPQKRIELFRTNLLGQVIDSNYVGVVLIMYVDGIERSYQ